MNEENIIDNTFISLIPMNNVVVLPHYFLSLLTVVAGDPLYQI